MAKARELVLAHGWNSTSHQVLDSGLRHWFSAAGDAVVAYVDHLGLRVVAGAPVAPDARLAAVAEEFEEASLAAGRLPCYFAAEQRLVDSAPSGRYAAHLIGAQPTWEAASWARRFDACASLRAQRNRALNKGMRVVPLPASGELAPGLRACHAAWLASKGLPRLGFLAHLEAERAGSGVLADRRLFAAVRAGTAPAPEPDAAAQPGGLDGASVLGYLTAAPVPGRNGWLIAKVVRQPRAPNGTAELLIDTAARALADGAERLTLGLAPLMGGEAVPGPTAVGPAWLLRAERLAARRFGRLYDFSGLYEFKRKFRPEAWEPVYLLTLRGGPTVRTCAALACAFLWRRKPQADGLGVRGRSSKGKPGPRFSLR